MKVGNLKQKIAQDKGELTKLSHHNMKDDEPPAKTPEKSPPPAVPKKADPPKLQPGVIPKLPAIPKAALPKEEEAPKTAKAESPALIGAREDAQRKVAAARDAKAHAQTLTERSESLRTDIQADTKLLDTAQEARSRGQSANDLEAELKRQQAANAGDKEIQRLCEQIEVAEGRFAAADEEVKKLENRLRDRRAQLAALTAERNAAVAVARNRAEEADAADEKVRELVNPYTPRNILQWLIDHCPRLLAILLIMWLLQRLVRIGSRRFVNVVVTRTGRKSQRKVLEDRVDTLNGVFRNTASLLILAGGTLTFLQEVGIPIIPLMGGAAVFGLAFAFGAQNLIKDYFSGFMILLEDQYAVRDVVKIGEVAGLVERISLRVTMLRDLDGNAPFHSQRLDHFNHQHDARLVALALRYRRVLPRRRRSRDGDANGTVQGDA